MILSPAPLRLRSSPPPHSRIAPAPSLWVNDVHSQLNRTRVQRLLTPRTEEQLAAAIRSLARQDLPIAASGSRHAMGGQQFARNGALLDLRQLDRVLSLDRKRGLIEVQAGIQWPALIQHCLEAQRGSPAPWVIAQKQTGADDFTLGGSLSANIHGRGLSMKPLVGDIESFTLVNAAGETVYCSRTEHPELFRLAIGGYGLFVRPPQRLPRHEALQPLDPQRKLAQSQ